MVSKWVDAHSLITLHAFSIPLWEGASMSQGDQIPLEDPNTQTTHNESEARVSDGTPTNQKLLLKV